MDALLTDINQAGLGRGLQFELFKPAPGETQRDFYAELPITIKVTGNYHDLGSFASDIGKLSRIVTLNDIGLSATKDTLVADATPRRSAISTKRKSRHSAGRGGGQGWEEMKPRLGHRPLVPRARRVHERAAFGLEAVREGFGQPAARTTTLPEVKSASRFPMPRTTSPIHSNRARSSRRSRKVSPVTQAPDPNRRKEPLEAYPLENLKMVGTLQQKKDIYAVVRTPDNRLFQASQATFWGRTSGVSPVFRNPLSS